MEVFDNDYENYQESLSRDYECQYCGEECNGSFCNSDCQKGYEHDMFND